MLRTWIAASSAIALLGIRCLDQNQTSTSSQNPPSAPVDAPQKQNANQHIEEVDWSKAFHHTVRYDASQSALIVDVALEPGFHAYTVGETIGRPLLLALKPDGAFVVSGDVQYPVGTTKVLPIGQSVIVEGSARVVAKLARRPGAATGNQAEGTFRYQVCSETACDRPRTVPFAIEVTASDPASDQPSDQPSDRGHEKP
ncbi:MAG: hypothetical protein IPK13_13325 [Deltaproteobacteria bacterium]|nr:hypothetical protein [Deltaproteobacteria bacterium]